MEWQTGGRHSRLAGAGRLPERANLSAAWGVQRASVAGSWRAPGQFDGVQPSGLGQARTTAHEGSLRLTEIAADSRLSRICLWFPQVPSNRPARALRSKSEQMAIQRQPPIHVTLRARVGRWGHLCPLLAVRLWLNRGWRPFFCRMERVRLDSRFQCAISVGQVMDLASLRRRRRTPSRGWQRRC